MYYIVRIFKKLQATECNEIINTDVDNIYHYEYIVQCEKINSTDNNYIKKYLLDIIRHYDNSCIYDETDEFIHDLHVEISMSDMCPIYLDTSKIIKPEYIKYYISYYNNVDKQYYNKIITTLVNDTKLSEGDIAIMLSNILNENFSSTINKSTNILLNFWKI